MQLQRIMLWLVAIASVACLTSELFGQFDAKANENGPLVQTQSPDSDIRPQEGLSDAPYVPTAKEVVEEILKLAQVTGDDVLYDLGSGDGRIVITAAQKLGTRGVGIEINPRLVQQSRENARVGGVGDRVKFIQQNLFEADIKEATVVTLYLLSEVNLKLRPKLLKQLKPGTRIVSHNYDMGEWKPDRIVRFVNQGRQHVLYYWVVPDTIPENLR